MGNREPFGAIPFALEVIDSRKPYADKAQYHAQASTAFCLFRKKITKKLKKIKKSIMRNSIPRSPPKKSTNKQHVSLVRQWYLKIFSTAQRNLIKFNKSTVSCQRFRSGLEYTGCESIDDFATAWDRKQNTTPVATPSMHMNMNVFFCCVLISSHKCGFYIYRNIGVFSFWACGRPTPCPPPPPIVAFTAASPIWSHSGTLLASRLLTQ